LASITQLEGNVANPVHGTLNFHQVRVQQLSELTTADEAKRTRIVELQNRIATIDTDVRRVRMEIETIEGLESEKLSSLRLQRRSTYYAYFDTLDKERKILAELYEPLQQHLSLGEQQERPLDFAIRQNVDLFGWIEKGARLFNQRKRLPYATPDDMAAAAAEHLLPAWRSGHHSELEKGLGEFLKPYGEAGTTVGDYLKPSQTVADFFDWLYSTDHISLTYGLSYNGTPLENLSPGTKGIVLLILYLAMDKKDTRPLLIDQPEENLDNESIYSLLASYFRRAKLRRQILLITHNPNLVVNTDAEQVIVARCIKENGGLPSFSYSAGALEDCQDHQSTKHQVCRILEGGAAAFQKRERRYSLDI
jgi:AAA domain, putative AbiEii toxin, Type IV TA system